MSRIRINSQAVLFAHLKKRRKVKKGYTVKLRKVTNVETGHENQTTLTDPLSHPQSSSLHRGCDRISRVSRVRLKIIDYSYAHGSTAKLKASYTPLPDFPKSAALNLYFSMHKCNYKILTDLTLIFDDTTLTDAIRHARERKAFFVWSTGIVHDTTFRWIFMETK